METVGAHQHPSNDPLNDHDLTITADGLPYNEDEDLVAKVDALIRALGDDVYENVKVIAVTRIIPRTGNKPGLVKIALQNLQEKIRVLRNKMNLKDNPTYATVYIKSSKSHAERLIESNTRAILRELPGNHSLRIDANGRIRKRTTTNEA